MGLERAKTELFPALGIYLREYRQMGTKGFMLGDKTKVKMQNCCWKKDRSNNKNDLLMRTDRKRLMSQNGGGTQKDAKNL